VQQNNQQQLPSVPHRPSCMRFKLACSCNSPVPSRCQTNTTAPTVFTSALWLLPMMSSAQHVHVTLCVAQHEDASSRTLSHSALAKVINIMMANEQHTLTAPRHALRSLMAVSTLCCDQDSVIKTPRLPSLALLYTVHMYTHIVHATCHGRLSPTHPQPCCCHISVE
jgi:hypothetical protein